MHRVQQGGHLHLAARQHFGSVRLKSTSRLCKQLGRIHEPRAPPCGVTAVRQRARRTTVNIDVSPVTSINRRIRSPPSDVVYCSWRAGEISSSTKLKAINRNELNDFKAVLKVKDTTESAAHKQAKPGNMTHSKTGTLEFMFEHICSHLWYNNYVEFTVTFIMLLSGWKNCQQRCQIGTEDASWMRCDTSSRNRNKSSGQRYSTKSYHDLDLKTWKHATDCVISKHSNTTFQEYPAAVLSETGGT